jgi:carboxypeptidase PM20D1
VLSAAIERLEANPFPAKISGPTGLFFDYVGREMLLFIGWFCQQMVVRPGAEEAACQFTGHQCQYKDYNCRDHVQCRCEIYVLPSSATAAVNFRIIPGESVQSVITRVNKVINDPRGERYNIDRDPQGRDTLFGTTLRNIAEEERAMKAGLAPGQVVPACACWERC